MSDSKITIFRLISGQEIIGELISDNETSYKVKNPLNLVATFNGEGGLDVQLGGLLVLGKEDFIELNKNVISYPYAPVEDLEQNYRKQFSTIITPKNIINPKQLIKG